MSDQRTVNLEALVPVYVRRFEPYVPCKPDEELKKLYRCSTLFRLHNNENPLGPPPEARDVISTFNAAQSSLYPSGDAFYLRCALAERFELAANQFIVGNGATEVITFVIKAFCQDGDNIVTADRTFAVYEWVATFSGIEARLAPLADFAFDEGELLQRVDSRTKVIFLCNPNNPTGTWWDEGRLRAFLDAVGPQRVVVLDEAYAEFVDRLDFPDGMRLLKEYPNLIVFRTFSKMYGLAGLRVGYLAASQALAEVIRHTGIAYSVNSIAQAAALAALMGDAHVRQTRDVVATEMRFLVEAAAQLHVPVQADQGCYVMMRMPVSDTLIHRKLLQHGLMVRSMTGFRFPNWIRVSIGLHDAMEAFVSALEAVLSEVRCG